jgi:hypothetical protein
MNKTTLTHRFVRERHLLVIVALVAGLALALGVVLLAQAATITMLQLQPPEPTTLTLLPDQATNTLPADTSHQFTALVLSQYHLAMKDVQVSFSTDSGQFQGDGQYVEVLTDQFGQATVTIISTTVGTASIRAWIDDDGDDTYDDGELTDEPSTKIWQEAEHPDFGDAPDSYGTLSATIGARHTITPLHQLGLTVDGEPDGQPSGNADGDDLNSLDDEDGVVLQPILVPGIPAAVAVHGGPSGGKLDAWIDFNDNKSFDHPGEHLFGGTSRALTPGVNPLSFTVPATAATGITTCARFRLSISGGLLPTGPAPDGEVEDYVVEIQELPEDTGTIVIQKTTDPPGATDFSFLDDFGIPFSLDDGVTLTFPYIPAPFTYTITETLPIGWEITGLSCVEDGIENSTIDQGAGQVTIKLEAGETITCTFNNAQLGSIVLRKRTYPPFDISFDFLNDLFGIGIPDLSLEGDMTLPIPFVPAGKYSVTEADPTPFGFDLIDVDCEDPDGGSFIDLNARTATIDLDAGETITCTFTNGVPPEPVGGIIVPVSRLGLLAPWLGLAALASLAALTVTLVRRRKL